MRKIKVILGKHKSQFSYTFWIRFRGKKVATSTLRNIWNKLTTLTFPNDDFGEDYITIQAFVIPRNEFNAIRRVNYHPAEDLKEHGYIAEPDDVEGFICIRGDRQSEIFLPDDNTTLQATLEHELEHLLEQFRIDLIDKITMTESTLCTKA